MSESNSKPTVATLTATFNRAHTLERAIKSCQNQSYPVSEIIIIDDGSSDHTPSLVANLAAKDPRIRYLRLPANRGLQYAHIQGIKMSQSDWIALVDSDDALPPHSIEVRISAGENCGFKPGLVYGDLLLRLSEDSSPVEIKYTRFGGYVYPELLRQLFICISSGMMIRRDCFNVSGFPDPSWRLFQDRDMIFTIAKHFPILHCGERVALIYGDAGNRISDGAQDRVVEGLRVWVKKYTPDIFRHHGPLGLFFWGFFLIWMRLFFFRRRVRKRHQEKPHWASLFACRFLDYTFEGMYRFLNLYLKDIYRK